MMNMIRARSKVSEVVRLERTRQMQLNEQQAKDIICKLLDQLSATKVKNSPEQLEIDLARAVMDFTWLPEENWLLHDCWTVLKVLSQQACDGYTMMAKIREDGSDPLSALRLGQVLGELMDRNLVDVKGAT